MMPGMKGNYTKGRELTRRRGGAEKIKPKTKDKTKNECGSRGGAENAEKKKLMERKNVTLDGICKKWLRGFLFSGFRGGLFGSPGFGFFGFDLAPVPAPALEASMNTMEETRRTAGEGTTSLSTPRSLSF